MSGLNFICLFIGATLLLAGCEGQLKSSLELNNENLEEMNLDIQIPSFITEYDHLFKRTPQRDLKLDITYPEDVSDVSSLRPAVILIHGGGWWGGDKGQAEEMKFLALNNVVSASIQYRLSHEGVNYRDMVADCKCAVQWLKAHAKEFGVDKNKIILWGYSAGAHLSLMSGLSQEFNGLEDKECDWSNENSKVVGIINNAGPTQIPKLIEWAKKGGVDNIVKASVEMVKANGDSSQYLKASPVAYLDKNDPPILTFHGTKDSTVAYQQAELLNKWATYVGTRHYFKPLKGVGHIFSKDAKKIQYRESLKFIKYITEPN